MLECSVSVFDQLVRKPSPVEPVEARRPGLQTVVEVTVCNIGNKPGLQRSNESSVLTCIYKVRNRAFNIVLIEAVGLKFTDILVVKLCYMYNDAAEQ